MSDTSQRDRDAIDPTALYDEAYYRNHCGPIPYEREEATWQTHFSTVARNLVQRFRPQTTLDVGCAKGFLVEQLRDLGVEAYGVDASPYAISQVREDIRPHCSVHSATEPFGRRYDLITCIEVIEHMSEDDAGKVIQNLCAHADDILFSSTPDDYEEPTHFNIQPFEYWKELFAQNGFYPVLRDEPTYVTECAVVFRKVTQKLKVVVLSREREEWAVVRLRLLDPLRELQRNGRLELTFVSTYDDAVDVEALIDADLWVIQREFADKSLSPGMIDAAKLLGKPIVFEIDDLLTNLPRSNPLWGYCQKITPDLFDCVRHADFVTTSTEPLLAELNREEPTVREKAFVRRNVVDTSIWGGEYRERRPLPGEPIVVGWFGSATHEEDLAIIKPAIQYLSRKYAGKVVFHFWGYLPEDLKQIPGVRLVRGPQANVVKHAQGVREARIDIAVAPLTDHVFNAAKSDLKWLEYSICGIPGIYSDVAPYREEIRDGIDGLIVANTTQEWTSAIEAMILDEEFRLGIAQRCFERVRGEFCVDARAMEWDDLYRSFVATGPREAPPRDAKAAEAAASEAAALVFEFQGRQQARNGRMADAVQSLESALDLDPARLQSVLSAGVTLSSQGRIAAGMRLLQACVNRVPGAADAHLYLARIQRSLGDPIRAEAALDAASADHAADPDLVKEHIEHLQETGQEEKIADRLAAVVAAELVPEEAVVVAEMLTQMGRAEDAIVVCTKASEAFPNVDFQPLLDALDTARNIQADKKAAAAAAAARSESVAPLRIAVYTKEPLSGPRVQTRLAGPLSVLEKASMIDVRWSDGVVACDAVDHADLIVLHRGFASEEGCGDLVERARAAGKPVVVDLDDLWPERLALEGDPRADEARRDLATLVEAADATTVTSEAMREALIVLAPGAADRIVVLEPMFDVSLWPSTLALPTAKNRPLRIGLFSGWSRPSDSKEIIAAIAPMIRSAAGKVQLTSWSPYHESKTLPKSPNVGAATPYYREYALALQRGALDLALVPASDDAYHGTLSDQVWLDLAACRVPGIYSARAPFDRSIISGQTGLLVGDDPREWAEATVRLLDTPAARGAIAERAWTIAFGERTMQQNAAAWFDLYLALVSESMSATESVGAAFAAST